MFAALEALVIFGIAILAVVFSLVIKQLLARDTLWLIIYYIVMIVIAVACILVGWYYV